MQSHTVIALAGFISWALLLLVVMEVIRAVLVVTGKVPANGFNPENSNLSPFMQRLARAHANCVESLPLFGGLMLVAIVTGNTLMTDSLAYLFLAMRIAQSMAHLVALSPMMVTVRFSFFAVQMIIGVWWAWLLMVTLIYQG